MPFGGGLLESAYGYGVVLHEQARGTIRVGERGLRWAMVPWGSPTPSPGVGVRVRLRVRLRVR